METITIFGDWSFYYFFFASFFCQMSNVESNIAMVDIVKEASQDTESSTPKVGY